MYRENINKKFFDIIFIIFILFLSYNMHTAIMETSYNGACLHSSDLDGYACFMAARHEPDLFLNDLYLKEHCSVTSFVTLQNFIADITKKINPTVTYGTALLVTQGITAFFYFLNFYILGIFLNFKRSIAAIMSLAMGVTIWVGFGTYWGLTYEALIPRTHFSVILPLIIILAYKFSSSYKKRIIVSLVLCLSVYVHSLNSIGLAAGIFFYFLLNKCYKISTIKHILHTLLCFAIYMISILAYMIPLVSLHHSNVNTGSLSIFKELYALRQTDYTGFLSIFYDYITSYWYIFILAIICAYLVSISCDKKQISIAKQLIFYSLGIIIASVVVNTVDIYIANKLNILPKMESLPRTLRFLLPFSIIIIFIYIDRITYRLRSYIYIPLMISFFIGVQYAYMHEPICKIIISNNFKNIPIFNAIYDETAETLKYEKNLYEAAEAVKKIVPSNEQIFTNKEYLLLRHYSLKNIAYSWKDGFTILLRKNYEDAVVWIEMFKRMKKSDKEYINIWEEKNIKWIFTDSMADIDLIKNRGGELLWSNSQFALLRKI